MPVMKNVVIDLEKDLFTAIEYICLERLSWESTIRDVIAPVLRVVACAGHGGDGGYGS